MICPNCSSEQTMVINSRQFPTYRRRRYECRICRERFNTKEETEEKQDEV